MRCNRDRTGGVRLVALQPGIKAPGLEQAQRRVGGDQRLLPEKACQCLGRVVHRKEHQLEGDPVPGKLVAPLHEQGHLTLAGDAPGGPEVHPHPLVGPQRERRRAGAGRRHRGQLELRRSCTRRVDVAPTLKCSRFCGDLHRLEPRDSGCGRLAAPTPRQHQCEHRQGAECRRRGAWHPCLCSQPGPGPGLGPGPAWTSAGQYVEQGPESTLGRWFSWHSAVGQVQVSRSRSRFGSSNCREPTVLIVCSRSTR